MSYSDWHHYSSGHGLIPSRSRSNQTQASEYWDSSRRQSTPIRWHPEYGLNSGLSLASSPSIKLDTIQEDSLPSSPSHKQTSYYGCPPIITGEYSFSSRETDNRRHSDSQLSSVKLSQRNAVKRYSHGDVGYFNSKFNDGHGHAGTGNSGRRPSFTVPDIRSQMDARSEVSETRRSVASVRSKMSSGSKFSGSGKSPPRVSSTPIKPRRRSEPYVTTSAKQPSGTSTASLDTRRKRTSRSGAASRTSRGARSVPSTSSHRFTTAVKGEQPVVFASIDIPSELLDQQVSIFRKLLGPIVVSFIVLALVVSLTTAVYFAVVLKETQDHHIEFLEATLQFTIAKNEQSRDINLLSTLQKEELKSAYCRQVDRFYRDSSFQSHYRGCEISLLNTDRIEFKLFFLEPTGPEKQADDIVRVLASKAKQVGQDGSSLRQISDVTLNIDPASSTIDLSLTKKPQDFYGGNSSTSNVPEEEENSQVVLPTENDSTSRQLTLPGITTSTTDRSTSLTTSQTTLEPPSVDDTVLSTNICNSIRQGEVVAHPSDCGHYVQCEFGLPIARPCHGGLVFDPASSACVKPRPDLPCREIQPCNNINGGYFAHPTNCHLFIICDQNKSVMKSCPTDLVWDSNSQNCVPRQRGTDCEPK